MTLLEVENLRFAYDGRTDVLKDISLTLAEGESVGLVGESGSGKTTILRLLLGLSRPTSGAIRFEGQPFSAGDRAFMRGYRRSVQTIFQDPYSSLDPRQRVLGIVREPLQALRIPGNHRQMVAEALAQVGLEDDAVRRYPHEFSGGQRQRIAIARAIVARPKLVLADEPVSALDLSTRVRIVDLLRAIADEVTLLMVSHDLSVVAALCEKIIVLDHGRIVEAGETAQVLGNPHHGYTKKLIGSIARLPR